jgi:hypothetical protein
MAPAELPDPVELFPPFNMLYALLKDILAFWENASFKPPVNTIKQLNRMRNLCDVFIYMTD